MQMHSSILLSVGTFHILRTYCGTIMYILWHNHVHIVAQSRNKFGANLINSHRAMDNYLHKKANLLSRLQDKPLMGII